MKLFLVISSLYVIVLTAELPTSIIPKCNVLKDISCFKKLTQDLFERLKTGSPEFNISPVDPLVIPDLTIGAGERVIQLTQHYKNASLDGIGKHRFRRYDIDIKNQKISLEADYDLVTLSGLYEFVGKILLFPVHGQGTYMIKLARCKITTNPVFVKINLNIVECERIPQKGKLYIIKRKPALTGKFREFNAGKCDVLHLGATNQAKPYTLNGTQLKSVSEQVLENGVTKMTFDFEVYTKDGELRIRGKNPTLSMNEVQKVTFQFDNLFDGNKELGDNINAVMNDNWKEVYDELSPAYFEAYAYALMRKVNRHMLRVPITDGTTDSGDEEH